MSRTSKAWEALQNRLKQSVETVTRSSRIDIVGGGVDEIDPPSDLDEFAEQAKTTGPIRKNLRQFVNDVWEPGYRVTAESEATEAYFMGGEEAPEGTPDDGFMSNCGVYAGERNVDFYDFGKETTWQRWVRGTILIEQLKADVEDPESPITGFYHIRPETVYAQVENNSNILLEPDFEELPDDISRNDVDFTRRDEVAAYIQFDDESILGLRNNGYDDKQQIPLSQNDVLKQTLEPDIGDNAGLSNQQGVFGTSIIEGISEDIAEYKQIKRDRAEAISRKAYGVWNAQFRKEVYDLGDTKEVVEWDNDSISDTEDELITMGPGDVLTSDAPIDLEKFESEVPELEQTIQQYINIILAPLPAPKYMVGFAEGINRDITEEQNTGYQDLVSEERRYQEKKWTPVLQKVARRQGLPDAESVQLKIEPEQEENPIKSLGTEDIERMNTYISALATAAGPQAGPTALVSREQLLEVMDFPVDEEESPEEMVEEVAQEGDEAARQAWNDVMGVEAMQTRYSEGDVVDTPDGLGVVSEIRTEGFTGPDESEVEASEDSPAYVVALSSEDKTVGVYTASDLQSGELPEVDVENPESDLDALFDLADAMDGEVEALQDGFFSWPDSWQESDQPARLIALKAWAGMGGRHTGCVREMRGNISRPNAFCADFKDRILGWEGWRQGGD